MSYYTYILAKYDISDCKTFEDVKNKFPDTSPAFLRKVIYLKGLRIIKEGKLRGISKRIMLAQRSPSKHKRSVRSLEGESFRKQKQERYPKVNCPQCGKEIFLVYPNDPFCSAKCRREYKKMRVMLKNGLVSRGRVRVRVPSIVQRTRLTSKFTNKNQHEDINYIEKLTHNSETTSAHVIKMKPKGESLEELRRLESTLKRRIKLTKGLIESQTEHLKKLRQDYYQVKYKREWLEYLENLEKRSDERWPR